jgi:hypothetical protein
MCPSQQRFEPGDLAGRQVEDGLVLESEQAIGEGGGERIDDLLLAVGAGSGKVVEHVDPVPAIAFGLIHGVVGVTDERGGCVACGAEPNPDAGGQRHCAPADVEFCAEQIEGVAGQSARLCEGEHTSADEHELVAADTGDDAGCAQVSPESAGDALERDVSCGAPGSIVDPFEMIDVDDRDSDTVLIVGVSEDDLQAFARARRVGELCQRIVSRPVRKDQLHRFGCRVPEGDHAVGVAGDDRRANSKEQQRLEPVGVISSDLVRDITNVSDAIADVQVVVEVGHAVVVEGGPGVPMVFVGRGADAVVEVRYRCDVDEFSFLAVRLEEVCEVAGLRVAQFDVGSVWGCWVLRIASAGSAFVDEHFGVCDAARSSRFGIPMSVIELLAHSRASRLDGRDEM